LLKTAASVRSLSSSAQRSITIEVIASVALRQLPPSAEVQTDAMMNRRSSYSVVIDFLDDLRTAHQVAVDPSRVLAANKKELLGNGGLGECDFAEDVEGGRCWFMVWLPVPSRSFSERVAAGEAVEAGTKRPR
jgi:hypothetical protein